MRIFLLEKFIVGCYNLSVNGVTVRLQLTMSDNPPAPVKDDDGKDRSSGRRRKRRAPSSSSDSSSSSSDSSSSSSSGSRRKRQRKQKRKKYQNRKFERLFQEIKSLKNQVATGQSVNNNYDYSDDVVDLNVSHQDSRELFGNEAQIIPAISHEAEFNVSVATITKEPVVPRASAEMLQHLSELQRFDHEDWVNVRYAEVQKSYLHSPGFTHLEANDEIRRYDNSKTTCNTEKAFAGVTYALLKQRDVLQKEMRGFLTWASQAETLSYDDIHAKISDIFTTGEYSKASSDTFQLVCGHRAEVVQHRREAILAAVKDPYYKSTLRKIPPTCTNLFNAEKFSAVLEKAGGVKDVFWPKEKDRATSSAPQKDPGTSSQSHPGARPVKQAQGYKYDPRPKNPTGNFRGRGGKYPSSNTRGRGGHSKRGGASYSPSSHRDRRAPTKPRY